MYRQSGTWSDYTESKLVSNCLPIREVTRTIMPTGRFSRSNFAQSNLPASLPWTSISKSTFSGRMPDQFDSPLLANSQAIISL